MSSRSRILRSEELVHTEWKKHAERKKKWLRDLSTFAWDHTTAVAAIALAGKPKIDEPLIQAWRRTLQYYEISVNDVTGTFERQFKAAEQLYPKIVGRKAFSSRIPEIF